MIGSIMRTRQERRYLTERYQKKQVRLAYRFMYDKPYDRERYIRTEFARKCRFFDILRGNYVQHKHKYLEKWMLNQNGNEHTMERWELGRYRNHSWDDCGRPKCSSCGNPRRGYISGTADDRITMQERIAKLHYEEEMKEYKERKR